jgi:GTP-binding protein Era
MKKITGFIMKEASRFTLRPSLWNPYIAGRHKCRLDSNISTSTTTLRYSSSPPSRAVRKRLDVAIVGPPNAGKSQLVNVLTKSPIAAVSRKRHTTRSDLLGARTIGETQIVFKDTPGFLRIENAKEERLDRDLIATAASEMQDVDFTLLVLDSARTLSENYRHALVQLMIGALKSQGRIEEEFEDDDREENSGEVEKNKNATHDAQCKLAIVLNKVDLIKPKSDLIDLAREVGSMADLCLEDHFRNRGKVLDFEAQLEHSPIVFYVSALKEIGTDDIMDHLLNLATPCREWAVEPGRATNMTTLEQVQEIIREKIYRSCHREVPHAVQQVNRIYQRIPNKGVVIHQDLVVFTKSHQKLVLGSSGRTLKRIEESARKDLRKMFGCDVALQLHVKFSRSKQRRGGSGGEYNLGEVSQSVL